MEETQGMIINDVTGMNPVRVGRVATPTSVEEVRELLRGSRGPVSVGGGHFSMGGQTASPGSLHLDMRRLNGIITFSPERRTIRVRSGARWCDIQRFVDPHDLSVKIMQTYANFTVGGSLSVNAHGRYVGLGPVILSVRSILLVLADGELVEASPTTNAEIFYGAIGGYGGLGVIVEAELDLVPNTRIELHEVKLPVKRYLAHFTESVRGTTDAVFHNADIYPPHFRSVRAITWRETSSFVTEASRLMPRRRAYRVNRYFIWAISETPFGKWRREHVIDPIIYIRKNIRWRNFEASYDVAELEPKSREKFTYVLQEYFVPFRRFDEFVPRMAAILRRHDVNALNVSVRHAIADPGSLLAWAREEVFAFVLYYKQGVGDAERGQVAVWTRELIDAAIDVGGTYYLPYQPHATPEQFYRAYPRAVELFALKRKLDPDFRFRGAIWDTYYAPTLLSEESRSHPDSEFHQVISDRRTHDALFLFLQNVYRLYPEDRFHALIKEGCALHGDDEPVYNHIQSKLSEIKPFLSELTFALPSLRKQKWEMTRQTLELLEGRATIQGYVEIGTTGRYISMLRKWVKVKGPIWLINDIGPTNSPVDIAERGGLRKIGRFIPLNDYQPISASEIPDASVDLVTCHIGLHHAPEDALEGFVASIRRMLRPGGLFIVRDHDVTSEPMRALVSMAHTIFNLGLGIPWKVDHDEVRRFFSVEELSGYLTRSGFRDTGRRLLQPNDPSDNTLMAFVKEGA